MKKIFTLITPFLVLAVAFLASLPSSAHAQIQGAVCPVGYVCTPIQPQPVSCPTGFTCTVLSTTTTRSLLQLIAPAAGEVVPAGAPYTIRWSATTDIQDQHSAINIVLVGFTSMGCDPFGCGMAPQQEKFASILKNILGIKSAEAQTASKITIAQNVSLKQGSYIWSVPANITSMLPAYGSQYKIFLVDARTNQPIFPYTDNVFSFGSSSSGGSGGGGGGVGCYIFSTNLSLGSTGADVSALQSWLIANGFDIPNISNGRTAKGYFGGSTQAALMKYQRSVGIAPERGYFGPITRQKVNASCGVSSSGVQVGNTSALVGAPVLHDFSGIITYPVTLSFSVTAGNQPLYLSTQVTDSGTLARNASIMFAAKGYLVPSKGALAAKGDSAADTAQYYYVAPGQTRFFAFQGTLDNTSCPNAYSCSMVSKIQAISYGTDPTNLSAYSIGSGLDNLQVTVTFGTVSKGPFTFLSPVGNQTVAQGEGMNVIWNSNTPTQPVDVYVLNSYGQIVLQQANVRPYSSGSQSIGFSTSATVTPLGQYTAKVCTAGTQSCSTSSGTFTVISSVTGVAPAISQVTPQPANPGSSVTVYVSGAGRNGNVILQTQDGSKSWTTGYSHDVSTLNGFSQYDGTKLTFTMPTTIGRGVNPGYWNEPTVPLTSGTYNLTISALDSSNNFVKSNVMPVTVGTSAGQGVQVISPNGGESYTADQPIQVAFRNSSGRTYINLVDSNNAAFDLISYNNYYNHTVSDPYYPPADSSVSLYMPKDWVTSHGNQYEIEICSGNQCDRSNGFFTVGSQSGKVPIINGITAPTQLNVNQQGTWMVNAYDPNNGSLSYSVDWGDTKNSCPVGFTCGTMTLSATVQQTSTFTHSYSNSGTYTIRFTVRNSSGQTTQSSVTVQVGNATVSTTNDCSISSIPSVGGGIPKLFNIDFGPWSYAQSSKSGPAIVGNAGDFWNTVAIAFCDDHTDSNLKNADGTPSPIVTELRNLGGSWGGPGLGLNDVMLQNFNYPANNKGGNAYVILNNVPAGMYDLYLYNKTGNAGQNGDYTLTVGGRSYGHKVETTDPNSPSATTWQENNQFVKFSNVSVNAGDSVTILIQPSVGGLHDAQISGLQLAPAGTPAAVLYTQYSGSTGVTQLPSLSVNPSSVTSGQRVTLQYTIPNNAVSMKLNLACPNGVSMPYGSGGNENCNTPMSWSPSFPSSSTFTVINNTSSVQQVPANLSVTYPDGSTGAVTANVSIQPSQIAAPKLSATCSGSAVGASDLAWTAQVTGGTSPYSYQWSVYNDVSAYTTGSTQSSSFGASYSSSGDKQAVARIADSAGSTVSTSCTATIPSVTASSTGGLSATVWNAVRDWYLSH